MRKIGTKKSPNTDTFYAVNGAHTLTGSKTIEVHSMRIMQQLLNTNKILTKILLLGPVE